MFLDEKIKIFYKNVIFLGEILLLLGKEDKTCLNWITKWPEREQIIFSIRNTMI